jgi:Ca2+-binding EF-hand superfamily protein
MNRRLWLIFLALMFSALFARGQSGQSLLSDEVFRKLAEESFVAHDVDKDGYLVGEEIPQDIRYMMILAKACPETRLNLQQFLEYREAAYRFRVAAEFKMRDRNDDGILQMHEMPLALMKHLGKYSSGGDRVNLQEYLKFCLDRDFRPPPPQPHAVPAKGMDTAPPPPIIIIDSTDVETRPIVYRAGKLPKGLPEWFERLDTDKDGQVSLFEWRKAGKPLNEFKLWDRNDDSLITPEEALYKVKQDRASRAK